MSYGGYQQYSGNPYGQAEAGYGDSNPYGGTTGGGYGAANPYGGPNNQPLNPPPLQHGDSQYSQGSTYSVPGAQSGAQPGPPLQHGAQPLTQQDFLARIDGVKGRISQLTTSISEIANIHQRMLSTPDSRQSAQLESIVSDTQIRNTQIKDEIKFLEKDLAREPNNSFKKSQVDSLKRTFKSQLDDFNKEEHDYSKRYREAIARQYRIVNPDATEQEVQEAANADWGDEGIFQQALKSNRSGQASSALGAVRARHNDIQRIEKTMQELSLLFTQLAEEVTWQETKVESAEQQTDNVIKDAENANQQLDRGIVSARRARKLKWWCLGITVLILCIIALILGLWFGIGPPSKKNNNNNNQ